MADKVLCKDCGTPYGQDDWIDMVFPNDQWKLISPDDGILCANCIIKRASRFAVIRCEARLIFQGKMLEGSV